MSTILKALRRLEQEKGARDGRPLKDAVTAAPAAWSRRRFPLLALMLAAGALGLGLGASLLWLWPSESVAPQVAEAPPAQPRASAPPPAPVAPVVVAEPPALPPPTPAASVASPSPPAAAAFASPVAVVARPEPPRAVEPAPTKPPEPIAAKPAAPARGSLPPFARKRASAPAKPPAPVPVARADLPAVLVSSTVWHPQRDRRLAMVALEGGAARELHEGDAIGSLVVSEIGPSAVVFLHDGVELRRRVGSKN